MEKVLIIAIVVLYLKWIFITLLYPLEACWGLYQNHKSNKLFKLLAVPSYCIERMLRFGGGRFLIFDISTIPSNHLRRFLYKGLGAHIASKVVFHFRTEIRSP